MHPSDAANARRRVDRMCYNFSMVLPSTSIARAQPRWQDRRYIVEGCLSSHPTRTVYTLANSIAVDSKQALHHVVATCDRTNVKSVYSSEYNLTLCPIKKRYSIILIKVRNNSGIPPTFCSSVTPGITFLAACHWLRILRSIRSLAKISCMSLVPADREERWFEVDHVVLNDTSNIIPLSLTGDQKNKLRRPQLYQSRSAEKTYIT